MKDNKHIAVIGDQSAGHIAAITKAYPNVVLLDGRLRERERADDKIKFCLRIIKRKTELTNGLNSADNVVLDMEPEKLINEYNLIQEKKSNLPSKHRDLIKALVSYMEKEKVLTEYYLEKLKAEHPKNCEKRHVMSKCYDCKEATTVENRAHHYQCELGYW